MRVKMSGSLTPGIRHSAMQRSSANWGSAAFATKIVALEAPGEIAKGSPDRQPLGKRRSATARTLQTADPMEHIQNEQNP